MDEQMIPTPVRYSTFEGFVALAGGFMVGIGAQILLQAIVNTFVGPVPALWTGKMWLLVAILLVPPALSYWFWVVEEGSLSERFAKGVQAGALFGFIVALVRALP